MRLRLNDEGGRIDIGRAPLDLIASMLRTVGAPPAVADDLARRIVERRGSPRPANTTTAAAVQPCCGIQSVDARTGLVTAIDHATGQSFQFQVANPQGLRPGQPVYGNAASGRVGLTPGQPCCSIVSRGSATGAARSAGGAAAGMTQAPPDARPAVGTATGMIPMQPANRPSREEEHAPRPAGSHR